MNPPFIAKALREGAVLTGQFSTGTGFGLYLSWPMLEGIPHLEVYNADFGGALADMERAVIEHEQQEQAEFDVNE